MFVFVPILLQPISSPFASIWPRTNSYIEQGIRVHHQRSLIFISYFIPFPYGTALHTLQGPLYLFVTLFLFIPVRSSSHSKNRRCGLFLKGGFVVVEFLIIWIHFYLSLPSFFFPRLQSILIQLERCSFDFYSRVFLRGNTIHKLEVLSQFFPPGTIAFVSITE